MKTLACLLALAATGCASTMDLGGSTEAYTTAGLAIKQAKVMWQIPEICFSACTMKAAIARPYACLGPKAQMGFHAVRLYKDGSWDRNAWNYYPNDIAVFFGYTGGLPVTTTAKHAPVPRDAYWMPRWEALKFWPACSDTIRIRHETGDY